MQSIRALLTALVLCAAPAQAQTLKSLAYNTTNDTVVQTQRITFPLLSVAQGTAAVPSIEFQTSSTNTFGAFASSALGVGPYIGFSVNAARRFFIATNTIRAELPISFGTTTNAAETRTNLSLGAAWLTNSDVTNFRTAIGLGTTNTAVFLSVNTDSFEAIGGLIGSNGLSFEDDGQNITRTNLGLVLPALTNTSNVSMMRALAGSTNVSEPFTGTFYAADPEDGGTVKGIVVVNGIIVSVVEP